MHMVNIETTPFRRSSRRRGLRPQAALLAAVIALLALIVPSGCKRQEPVSDAASSASPTAQATATPTAATRESAESTPTAKPTALASQKPAPTSKAEDPAATNDAAPLNDVDQEEMNRLSKQAGLPAPPDFSTMSADMADMIADAIHGAAQKPSLATIGKLGHIYYGIANEREMSDRAVACLEKAAELDPQNFHWHYLLARTFVSRQSFPRARMELDKAKELNPDYAMIDATIGELELNQDAGEAARPHFLAYVDAHPNDSYGLSGLAAADLLKGETEKAKQTAEQAIAIEPREGRAHRVLAKVYEDKGMSAEANRELMIANRLPLSPKQLERDPAMLKVWRDFGATPAAFVRIEAFAREGDHESAILLGQEILENNPQSARCAALMAYIYQAIGEFDQAVAMAEKALALDPDFVETRVVLGECYRKQGNVEGALAQAEKALSAQPDLLAALALKAGLLANMQEFDKALVAYAKARALSPHDLSLLFNEVEVLVAAGKFAEAEESLRSALEGVDPEDVPDAVRKQISLGLANVLTRKGEFDAALKQLDAADQLSPNDRGIFNSRVDVLVKAGREDEAVRTCLAAIDQHPDDASYVYVLGRLYVAIGRNEEAIAPFKEAIEKAPGFFDAVYALGEAYARLDRTEQAIEQFQKALEMQPSNPSAAGRLTQSLMQAGQTDRAVGVLREVVKKAPQSPALANSLAWVLSIQPDATEAEVNEAISMAEHAAELTERSEPSVLDTLAVTYAAAGRFEEATAIEQEVVDMCDGPPCTNLIEDYRVRLELFKSGQRYTEE